MRARIQISPRDLYLGCFSDIRGWGGALTSATAVVAASRRRGVSTLLLGATARAEDPWAVRADAAGFNVRLAREPLLWRVQSWRASRQLALRLRGLPPPRTAFLGLSPYWVIAAKQAWPNVPAFYRLPCILYNCLPFTWPRRRPPTVWTRLNFTGIGHAEHLAFAHADLTFVPTELARQEVLAFHPAARGRIYICPEGYEPRDVSAELRLERRRALKIDDDAVLFLLVGRCDLNKAFDWAVRELPLTGQHARLVIVGDGPQRGSLVHLASDLGVAHRVHVVGSQTDMEPWYAAADCVLSTSFYDTFPNALQEAMRRGRPVLVPEHAPPEVYAGFAEVVSREGGGLLYDRTRAGTLAACMNAVVRDASTDRTLSRQARQATEQWFRRGSIVDRIFTWLRRSSPDGAGREGRVR